MAHTILGMKNNNDEQTKSQSKPSQVAGQVVGHVASSGFATGSKAKGLSPKTNISSLCKEAQGFLDFLDKAPPPPDRTQEIELDKLFSKVKDQLEDF